MMINSRKCCRQTISFNLVFVKSGRKLQIFWKKILELLGRAATLHLMATNIIIGILFTFIFLGLGCVAFAYLKKGKL